MDELKKLTSSAKRLELFHHMGMRTLEDVYMRLPYRYDETKEIWPPDEEGRVCAEGIIINDPKIFFKGRISILNVNVKIKEEAYQVTIFNRHYLRPYLKPGTRVTIRGKCARSRITASSMVTKSLDELSGLQPVYSLSEGLSNKQFQKYALKALKLSGEIKDFTPPEFKQKRHLMAKKDALYQVHDPHTAQEAAAGMSALKYEEFLKFQLTMQYNRVQREKEVGIAKRFDHSAMNSFLRTLPYKLTADQQQAVLDIFEDLEKPSIMYRLLQGDVGSGKTAVALIGLYANYLAGYQGALMAPTEVLASQHYATLKHFFARTEVRIALLVGALSPREKEAVYQRLSNGEIDIVVGTHALFQDKVTYHKLGFVITDEQHRFGVEQRKALREKGQAVDFLVMSATPIPRTLSLTLYGDMDVSTIHTMPGGRKPTITRYIKGASMKPFLGELKAYLASGGQAYVICPAVEDDPEIKMKAATQIAAAMKRYFEPRYHVGLLYGGMPDHDKNSVMEDFSGNKLQILVSTTVIEVGIDVSNANFMVIYDADRFGMSQLHQLRGRVGRGGKQGYCFLLSRSEHEEAIERLKFLEKNNDGFVISQYDLKQRGPGEILGERQSGLPSFMIGDVFKDFDILELAYHDALKIIEDHYKYGEYDELILAVTKIIKSGNEYID